MINQAQASDILFDLAHDYKLEEILPPLTVSHSQKIVQQTPIATADGSVYIVNIEPGEAGDTDGVELRTVVRQGKEDASGIWNWSSNTIEDRTMFNPWHTPPAIGVDSVGFVHVAFNMHNLPWQYSRSDEPLSISEFTFLGDDISLKQLKKAKFENKTSFKSMGYADIPGNQITYPAFFNDSDGHLFVSYRFAAKPARQFKQRTMSAGLAKYKAEDESWASIGGSLNVSKGDYDGSFFKTDIVPAALASETGWTAYHPRLAFDSANTAYIVFFWREGIAGEELTRPCIITSENLTEFVTINSVNVTLPMKPEDCDEMIPELEISTDFYSIGSIAVKNDGVLTIVLSPLGEPRVLLTRSEGMWFSEESPYGATDLFVDYQNNLWAISTGLGFFVKREGEAIWENVFRPLAEGHCFPRSALSSDKKTAFIYSQSCDDSNTVTVHSLSLDTNS